MTEKPAVKTAAPESPPQSPEGNPPTATTPRRSRRKKILVPVVLAVIGLALLLAGFLMYPRRMQPLAPITPYVLVTGSSNYVASHIYEIDYTVDQVNPDVARLQIRLWLSPSVPPGAAAQILMNEHLGGAKILRCVPDCSPPLSGAIAAYFNPQLGWATAYFYLKARSFGVAANGVAAEVGFPALSLPGNQHALMFLTYHIPSASAYDWSSYPTESVSNSTATWSEPVIPGGSIQQVLGFDPLTNARIPTGINHTAEANDSTLTLVAGILFGLGGGALVAAVQEALHD